MNGGRLVQGDTHSVCISVWCRLEDTKQEMIEQRAELQREQSVGESGRGKGCG